MSSKPRIYGRVLADGRTWWYLKEGRNKGATNLNTTDRSVAESILAGRLRNPDRELKTHRERLDGFLAARAVGHEPKTVDTDGQRMARLARAWSDVPMEKWRQESLLEYMASHPWGPNSKRLFMGALKRWLGWCRSKGYAVPDILHGLKPPTIPEKEMPHLEPEELERLLAEVASRPHTVTEEARRIPYKFEVFVGLGALAAIRKGEIRRARWSDVDFEKRTIYIEKTKTHKARTVPLPKRLVAILKRHRAVSGPVYRGPTNEWRTLKNACQRAGIRHVGPHGLRHTGVTAIVRACNGDLKAAGLITGQSLQMLMRYNHPGEEQKRALMDRAFG